MLPVDSRQLLLPSSLVIQDGGGGAGVVGVDCAGGGISPACGAGGETVPPGGGGTAPPGGGGTVPLGGVADVCNVRLPMAPASPSPSAHP